MNNRTPEPAGRTYGGKPSNEREEERRSRLLQAATELFGTQGYAATTLQQICSTARVAPRHFYEHFDSREAVLLAILDRLREGVASAIAGSDAADARDVAEHLRAKLAAVIGFYAAHPALARINCIEIVGVSERVEQRRREKSRHFAQWIVDDLQGLARRRLIAKRDYTLTAIAMIGAIDELLTEWVLQPQSICIEAIIEESLRLLVAAVARP